MYNLFNTSMKKSIISLYVITMIIICSCSSNKPKIINLLTTNKHNVESQTPKNIILMIGDGMGLGQITAAMYTNNDFLNIQEFQNIGLIKTNSSSSIITDSAAGATAFSTGKKTYNGAINMDKNKSSLIPITSTLKKHKYKTGIITTSSVTHATPACFYGNQIKRYGVDEELALQFTETDIDLLMGGGESFFNERKDGQDLTEILKNKNYLIIDSIIDKIPNKTERLINFCAPKEPVSKLEGRGDYLPIATQKGIAILNTNNQKGFFLMIEGAQIDWGGHDNDSDYIISETLDFDSTIVVSGVSKAYSMTGFRVGWLLGSKKLVDLSTKLQEAFLSCGVPFSQAAAITAIDECLKPNDTFVRDCVAQYKERRDSAIAIMSEHDSLVEYTPAGAFYCLIPIKAWLERNGEWLRANALDTPHTEIFCHQLLQDHQVAVSPGETFGTNAEQHIRVSLAQDQDTVEEGMRRLCRFITDEEKVTKIWNSDSYEGDKSGKATAVDRILVLALDSIDLSLCQEKIVEDGSIKWDRILNN